MILAWLCLIALGVSNVAHAQSCDERVKAEVTNPGNTQYIVILKKADGNGRWFRLTFTRPLTSITSGEAKYMKKVFKSSYWFRLYRNARNQLRSAGQTRIRVQVQFTQNAPVPTVTKLMFSKKSICDEEKNKTMACVDKISATDCNSYFMKKRSNEDSEFGMMKLPVPGKLSSWKLVIGFEEEMQNIQVVSALPEGRECNKIFKSASPPHRMRVRRKNKFLMYRMHYSRDYAERPKVSYIFFGNEVCNQTCGTMPVCPPPTTEAPTTQPPEVTTAAPEVTTEAPPEVTTAAPEVTTEAPEVTTAAPPPEETTAAPPPEETTEAPGEETTAAPPPEETTEAPEETTEAPEETTEAPEVTTAAPPPEETTEAPEETTEAPGEETTEAPEETTETPPEVTTKGTEAPPPPEDITNKDEPEDEIEDTFDDIFHSEDVA